MIPSRSAHSPFGELYERSRQGLQLCADNASFGSFCNSLLTAFRDEFPKRPAFTFAVLSNAVPGGIDVDDVRRSSAVHIRIA